MKEISYMWAINEALKEEMERDEAVVLIGEDVGIPGGAFGASRGLYDRFGPERVFDTPISKAGIMGLAAGAAACGLRPIVEIMFMDFVPLCMDAIVNQIAKIRYTSGSQYTVPIVIRTPAGAGLNAGPQHSQSLEAWFAHVPSLKVVILATPYDVKNLLKSAIREDNPVIVVENKALHALKTFIPEEEFLLPIGKADIIQEGSDVTVVAISRMVHQALKAADILGQKNVNIEVTNLLSISRWDKETVFQSVAKTHRLVIAHEAVKSFGVGAEISAAVAENIMHELGCTHHVGWSAFRANPIQLGTGLFA